VDALATITLGGAKRSNASESKKILAFQENSLRAIFRNCALYPGGEEKEQAILDMEA